MSSSDETLPSPTPGAASPAEMFGGYQIGRELGRGGMGVVYCAMQASLKRTVALKMLTGRFSPEDLARFLAEAETSAALQHSNIVHIYEVGEKEGVPFFAMEFVEGGSLADRMKRGVLQPREAAALMMTLARAVHFAHEHGVVHRDLKPGNVLLDHDGTPKVADFGIAKRLKDDSMLTSTGAIMGTPCYMAPEQAGGTSHKAGPSADIYSLGAMLYELLTGRPPFLPHESDQPITLRVLNEDPVSPAFHRPEIPRDLEAICMMCLQKDTRDRFVSAQALADDLQRFLNDEPIFAKPPTRIRRTVKWMKRHPWSAIAWAASFMICGAGLQWLWQWEMHQRPRFEYATSLDIRDGGIEAVGAVSEADSKHFGICLRLTRQGRQGKIVKAEAVNPKGSPATVRDLLNYDLLPTWLEGAMGFQSQNARGRETVGVDVTYAGDEAQKVTGRDRNGRVTVSINYLRGMETNAPSRAVRAQFMNMRSFDYAMPSGASRAEFQRDEAGHDVRITFFNSAGKPARNGEGVFGYEMKRNAAGRVETLLNIDDSGRPMANVRGVTQMLIRWNERGNPTNSRFCDAAGRPVLFFGMAGVEAEYDAAGNLAVLRRLDTDGKLKDCPDGDNNALGLWAVKEFARNDSGEITGITYRTADPRSVQPSVNRVVIAYDESGFPADSTSFSPKGVQSSHLQYRRDGRGNVIEEKELDGDGDIVSWTRRELDEWGNPKLIEELDEEGKVEERTLSTYRDDHLISEFYEFASHQPRPVGSGYTKLECSYHENGHRIEELYSGFKNNSLALRVTFDELGRRRQETWINDQQKPVTGLQGWTRRQLAYRGDNFGVLTESYEDADGKPAPGSDGWVVCRNEFSDDGLIVARVFEGFDAGYGYARKHQRLSARGLANEEWYLDAAGGKAWCKDGYHRIQFLDYNDDGLPTLVVSEEFDPSRFQHFRVRAVETWKDEQLARVVISYEDRDGKPVSGPDQCTGLEKDFDEDGREVARVQTGCATETYGAPVWRTDTEWNEDGTMRRRIIQAFDAQRVPLPAVTTEGAARTEQTFDEKGVLRRLVRDGMAENLTGFSRIVDVFDTTGKLESTTHTRRDGAPVKVRVVIISVDGGAQEKAADLRVGDFLTGSNGRPVSRTSEFVFGDPFPGGFLNVEREGRSIRVDGFKAGKIGIVLSDRAAP